jgi:hypothetical protein
MSKEVLVFRLLAFAGSAALFLIILGTVAADPPEPNVLVTMTWSGSVDDEKLMKDAPNCIVSDKGLDRIWEAWKIKEKKPQIDFKKFIVVVVLSSGSNLSLDSGMLDKKGNLELRAIATLDIAPGFRYVFGTVNNAGIKTVGGKKLPKE